MEENKHAHAAASSHFHGDASIPPIRLAVVTISDSRTPETDQNGQYLTQQIKDAGWELAAYHIVRDEPAEIEQVLQALQGSTVQVSFSMAEQVLQNAIQLMMCWLEGWKKFCLDSANFSEF